MLCSTDKGKRRSFDTQLGNGPKDEFTRSPAHNNPGLPSTLDHDREDNARLAKRHISEGDGPSPFPSISRYLLAVSGGSHWHAQESTKNIVIFGDSYSKLNDGETWAGRLGRRLRKQSNEVDIHNFAFPGATAEDDLSKQLSHFFKVFPKNSSSDPPALDADRSIYFVFVGINDCGQTESYDLESVIECILNAVHELYIKAGARNFVLMNVPPIDLSPQVVDAGLSGEMEERIQVWNELLQAETTEFGTGNKEATVLLFSSHQVLTEVLNDPHEFDFSEDDPTTEGGGIWVDDLHVTTEVHDVFAERLFTSVFSYQ